MLFCWSLLVKKKKLKSIKYQIVGQRSLADSCLTVPYFNGNDSVFTCSPGSYIIYNNAIRFSSEADYLQTIDFFNCASTEDIVNWLAGLPIETAYKVYQEFLNQFCDGLTQSELDSLLLEYEDEIIVDIIEEDLIEVSPLFYTLPQFRNMDGKFILRINLKQK